MLERLKGAIGIPFGRDVYLRDGLSVGDLVAVGDFPRVRQYGVIVSRREYQTRKRRLEYRKAIPVLTPSSEYTFSFVAIKIDPTIEIEVINQDYASRIAALPSKEDKEAQTRRLTEERDGLTAFIQQHTNKTSNT